MNCRSAKCYCSQWMKCVFVGVFGQASAGKAMVISLEDAVAILNKWKEESAHIVVAAESPFRQTLRGIHGHGVRWVMSQRIKVSRVSFFVDTKGSKQGIVEFEG